jgi:hypothetical protein
VHHALDTNNADIVCDQLLRFQEDIKRHSLGEEFESSVLIKLRARLKLLRLSELADAMVADDNSGAVRIIRNMIREGLVGAVGDVLKALTGGTVEGTFEKVAVLMATEFVRRNEAKAF